MSLTLSTELSVDSAPASGASFPSSATSLSYSKTESVPEVVSFTQSLAAAVGQSIMPATMTKVYDLTIRVQGGSVTLAITTSGGTVATAIPCDSLLKLSSRTSWLTGIAVSGTADIEVILAGE